MWGKQQLHIVALTILSDVKIPLQLIWKNITYKYINPLSFSILFQQVNMFISIIII